MPDKLLLRFFLPPVPHPPSTFSSARAFSFHVPSFPFFQIFRRFHDSEDCNSRYQALVFLLFFRCGGSSFVLRLPPSRIGMSCRGRVIFALEYSVFFSCKIEMERPFAGNVSVRFFFWTHFFPPHSVLSFLNRF